MIPLLQLSIHEDVKVKLENSLFYFAHHIVRPPVSIKKNTFKKM